MTALAAVVGSLLLPAGVVLVLCLLGTAVWGSTRKSPTQRRQEEQRADRTPES